MSAQPRSAVASVQTRDAPTIWLQEDGAPVSCREKLKTLAQNHDEVAQVIQDAFDDAILMGVDEAAIRRVLMDLVLALESPKRPASR